MIPGKKYQFDDYLRIAWQRRWSILIPATVIFLVTVIVASELPNRYRSQTTILVVPQRVPENYVKSTVTARIEDRLQVISQQIMSRTRLEQIVQEFDLYRKERDTMIMEDVIEAMRGHVQVNTVDSRRREEGATAFTVSYESEDPRMAMRVAERLASLFIKENLQDREVLANSTSQFLEAQLEDAKRRLMEHEQKLEAYKRQHTGELPTQAAANLQVLQSTQFQLQSFADGMIRDRDRRLLVERQLADALAERSAVPVVDPTTTGAEATPAAPASVRLEMARDALRALEVRLKPQHPDVVKIKRTIERLEVEADAEALAQPVSPAFAARPIRPGDLQRQNRITELRTELETLDRRIAGKQAEEQRLRAIQAHYQARVEATPARESEMVELMRDYETLKTMYTDLLKKREDAKIAVNLERRQIGEQFKILDGARLPEKPISPDRGKINFMGLLGGLAFGLAFVGLLEYRDSTLKNEQDVVLALSLPVLALIPAMQSNSERKRQRRRRLMLVGCTTMFVVGLAATAVWRSGVLSAVVK